MNMKINKKLSAAIVLSLMLGVYGSASADDPLYGAESGNVSGVTVNAKGVTTNVGDATNSGTNYTVISGSWDNVYGGYLYEGVEGNDSVADNIVTINSSGSDGYYSNSYEGLSYIEPQTKHAEKLLDYNCVIGDTSILIAVGVLVETYKQHGITSIAFPMLGCNI